MNRKTADMRLLNEQALFIRAEQDVYILYVAGDGNGFNDLSVKVFSPFYMWPVFNVKAPVEK